MIREIKCDATNCVFNEGTYECHAEHIDVDWSKGCDCCEAKCSTFSLDNSSKY